MPRSPPRSSLARLAMTSFTFMFVWVPLPVCQTTSGNSASCRPAITSSAAAMIALADRGILELAQVEVHLGRRPLHQGQGVDQLDRHPVFADLEVLERALSLRSPEPFGRNLHFAHRVGFDAELACHGIFTSIRPGMMDDVNPWQAGSVVQISDLGLTDHRPNPVDSVIGRLTAVPIGACHLPMQNRRKIRSRTSSVTTAPTTLPSSSTADRRSNATSSSPLRSTSDSAARSQRRLGQTQASPAPCARAGRQIVLGWLAADAAGDRRPQLVQAHPRGRARDD